MKTDASPTALIDLVRDTSESLTTLIESLPIKVKPGTYPGYGKQLVGDDAENMRGWEYNWDDSGDNPPPWGDIVNPDWDDNG